MISGINKTLFDWNNELEGETEYFKALEHFFTLRPSNWQIRQELALDIASYILSAHMKEDLPDLAVKLSQMERNLKEITPYQRDHVCHAVFTFVLGTWMMSQLNLYRHQSLFF